MATGMLDTPSAVAHILDKRGARDGLLHSRLIEEDEQAKLQAGTSLSPTSIYAAVASEQLRTKHVPAEREAIGSSSPARISFSSPPLVGPALALSLSSGQNGAGDEEPQRDAYYISAYGKELCLSLANLQVVTTPETSCKSSPQQERMAEERARVLETVRMLERENVLLEMEKNDQGNRVLEELWQLQRENALLEIENQMLSQHVSAALQAPATRGSPERESAPQSAMEPRHAWSAQQIGSEGNRMSVMMFPHVDDRLQGGIGIDSAKQAIPSSAEVAGRKGWFEQEKGDSRQFAVDEDPTQERNSARPPLTSEGEDEELRAGGDIRSAGKSIDYRSSRRRDDLIRDFDRTFGFTPCNKSRPYDSPQLIQESATCSVDHDKSKQRRQTLDEPYESSAAWTPGTHFQDCKDAGKERFSNSNSLLQHARDGGNGSAERATTPQTVLSWRTIDYTDMRSAQVPAQGIQEQTQSEAVKGIPSAESCNRRKSLKFLPSPPSSRGTSPCGGESSAENAQGGIDGAPDASLVVKNVSGEEDQDDIDIWEKALVVLVVLVAAGVFVLVVAIPVLNALCALAIASLAHLEAASYRVLHFVSTVVNLNIMGRRDFNTGAVAVDAGEHTAITGSGEVPCQISGCSKSTGGFASPSEPDGRHDAAQETPQTRPAPHTSSSQVELETPGQRAPAGDGQHATKEGQGIANTTDTGAGELPLTGSKSCQNRKQSWPAAFARGTKKLARLSGGIAAALLLDAALFS